MRSIAVLAAALYALFSNSPAEGAALKAATLGCKTPSDAAKAAELQAKKDKVGLEAFSRPLIASGACTAMGRGLTVDVDEKKLPLACVRLAGDLSCYWVADVFVDPYPGQKGAAESGKRGGHRNY